MQATSTSVSSRLPTKLVEPMIYLSARQAAVCEKNPVLAPLVTQLPGWVSQRLIGKALRKEGDAVERAVASLEGRPFVWATEFENVHAFWAFEEPSLVIGGTEFRDAESFYHACKPQPFDEATWISQRLDVMRRAVRAKLDASFEVRDLLVSTHPHPLLSIKPDEVWGFHPKRGGQNLLAKLYEEARSTLVASCSAIEYPPPSTATPPVALPGHPLAAFAMLDPRESAAGKVGVISFYWPGRDTPCDQACRAGFLSNFWLAEQLFAPAGHTAVSFRCAEAAFQACKFWAAVAQFALLNGEESFKLKQSLGSPDWSYAGHGSNWAAMAAVLRSKFIPGSQLAQMLVSTGDAFLLEHNESVGRDEVWSDNRNGEGTNWLGLQLMLLRDELRVCMGVGDALWTPWCRKCMDVSSGKALGTAWQGAVRSAARASQGTAVLR